MTTKVEKTVTVSVPIETAYNQWTQFEDFPQFMSGVQHVEHLDDKRLRWVAEIGGVRREWYATILEQRSDEKIAWAATEGATNAGAVSFASSGAGQTLVTLELEYEPEGVLEKAADALSIVQRQAESDLQRFKTFIESRRDATGAWRGDVEGVTTGTPGVEVAASSEGDSGKAGISGKAAAAGVAAVAAGVAAAAITRSRAGDDTKTGESTSTTDMPPVVASEIPPVALAEETTFTSAPLSDPALASDSYGMPADRSDEVLSGGVELDSTTPGVTENNDGRS